MASRVCLLVALCALFGAAWSNDEAHQEGVLIARRQAWAAANIAARKDAPPATAQSAHTPARGGSRF